MEYTYDNLGRVYERRVTSGDDTQTTTYEYVEGGYGTNSTTPLVETITQPGICFDYAYDNRGNIISEKRYAPGTAEADKPETTYAYDALGQLIRVNDPHEGATWVYTYDRGGNILSKTRYAFTTGVPTNAVETIPYTYGDSNWKDKLTAYNGVGITYDAIGNPLFDGERTYTWGAGRQLRHISMPASGTSRTWSITNGSDEDSQTILQIVRVNDTTLEAHVIRGNREITAERPANAFNWTRVSGNTSADTTWNNAHAGMKQITLTANEITGGMQFACTYNETAGAYGTVQVNDSLVASHTPATADANDVFTIENGELKVTTSATNGTDYELVNGVLTVNNGFTGTITSTVVFTNEERTKEIDFMYDHNGLRTGKVVTENGRTEITEYTLHGKLITHLTKRTVTENRDETAQELHFFYDAQSRPAFVKYNGEMYRYVHSLQGDIVGLLDDAGALVVEYKYDAWGKRISIIGLMANTLGRYNPYRYRGYVFDEETRLFYLRSRYYHSERSRFLNKDVELGVVGQLLQSNLYVYCNNSPIMLIDSNGKNAKSAVTTFLGFAVAVVATVIAVAINKKNRINQRSGRKLVSTGEVLKSMFLPIDSNSMKQIRANNGILANDRDILLCYPNGNNSIICYTINRYGSTFKTKYYYVAASLDSNWRLKRVLDSIFRYSEDMQTSAVIESLSSPFYSVIGAAWMSISTITLPEELMSCAVSSYWKQDDPLKPPRGLS